MRRLFITGERFTTEHAEKIGLIDFMVDQDELDEKINEYVDIIQSSGPIAIKEVKNLIGKYETLDIEKYKEFTVEKIAELRISKEGQEGIKAFLEKRRLEWKG
jgi:methylglutaconyl-CoA hydratase